jgi:hypothetical protein
VAVSARRYRVEDARDLAWRTGLEVAGQISRMMNGGGFRLSPGTPDADGEV